MIKPDGGAAFPFTKWENQIGSAAYPPLVKWQAPGLSKREWFAGLAIAAASDAWFRCTESEKRAMSGCVDSGFIFASDYPNFVKRLTAEIADAMLAEEER